MVDLTRLFHRMADAFEGAVEAEELQPLYARLTFRVFAPDGSVISTTCELTPFDASTPTGSLLELVRVRDRGNDPAVYVTAVASAVLAVCVR